MKAVLPLCCYANEKMILESIKNSQEYKFCLLYESHRRAFYFLSTVCGKRQFPRWESSGQHLFF